LLPEPLCTNISTALHSRHEFAKRFNGLRLTT